MYSVGVSSLYTAATCVPAADRLVMHQRGGDKAAGVLVERDAIDAHGEAHAGPEPVIPAVIGADHRQHALKAAQPGEILLDLRPGFERSGPNAEGETVLDVAQRGGGQDPGRGRPVSAWA